jgi:hypothetical protein
MMDIPPLHALPGKGAWQQAWLDGEWQRLRLLENAVLNYAGGLPDLLRRVDGQVAAATGLPADTRALLQDLAHYLRDVARTGQLNLQRRARPGHHREAR